MDDDGGGGCDDDDRIGGGVNIEDGDEDKNKHVGLALLSSVWWLLLLSPQSKWNSCFTQQADANLCHFISSIPNESLESFQKTEKTAWIS